MARVREILEPQPLFHSRHLKRLLWMKMPKWCHWMTLFE